MARPGTRWYREVVVAVLLAAGGAGFVAGSSSPAAAYPTVAGAESAGPATPDLRFVPNVETAFSQLARRPEALAFRRADSPEAGLCKHYQGMARWHSEDGTPYVFLTKSGNVPNWPCGIGVDQGHGFLIVARMGSRDKTGERLRSNLWPFGLLPASDLPHDVAVTSIALDGVTTQGEKVLPGYRHPGGMQIVDGVLAIGAENPVFASHARASILFFDVSNPESPRFITKFDPPDLAGDANAEFGADPVGLTAMRAPNGECCRYLMIVAGGPANKEIRFFRSLPEPGRETTDLRSDNLDWERVGFGTYTEAQLETQHCLGADWPTGSGPTHQMLNLVREGGLDGDLYIVGGRNETIDIPLVGNVPFGDELTDLYKVNLWDDGDWQDAAPGPCPFTHVNTREVGAKGHLFYDVVSNFAAASGVYVSPSGELIVYNAKHESLGGGVFFGEYRHFRMVRSGSPTLRPTAVVDGPFSVDEGSSIALTGRGQPAITQAWIQLFSESGARHTIDDTWLPIEYGTREADDFDELDRLGTQDNWSFAELTSSWLWFAPPGCTISANDYPRRSDDWPGPGSMLLHGTGEPEEATSLGSFDDDLEGVTFYHRSGSALIESCDEYYNASIGLLWNLGSGFATSTTFSAAELDGPDSATVQARAEHPVDKSPATGIGDPISVPIEVRNVAPTITAASVKDSLGYDLEGGPRKAIVGLPVELAVAFTDPGKPDTQTGSVDWGDGSAPDTSFSSFSPATGGVTGRLEDTHAFTEAGDFTIEVTVTDDDGGATSTTLEIEVLSLEDAIEEVADELKKRIGEAANARIAEALRSALYELLGNNATTPPTNGALDKLEADDPVSAITKLRAAIGYLQTAEARGAGSLEHLKDLLGLVAEAIATGAYQQALDAIPAPSPGQARALASIEGLISTGHQQLATGQYLKACDNFRQAVQKSLDLMK